MRTGSAGNLASLLSHRIPEVKEGRGIRCMQIGGKQHPSHHGQGSSLAELGVVVVVASGCYAA